VTLSEAETGTACRAARAAGLDFAGIDLQRAADGSGTFVLECNAAPMFANFDRRTGADVAGALANLLLERARNPAPAVDAARREER
jgi:glutathione synthase/RimK-type ligase-like ATP-grasp enzyme